MRRILGIILILALAAGMATNTIAKTERKEQPKARFVTETLEALGEPHYPEKIKIKRITSIQVGDTYYHIYEGKLDTVGFHIIVFDNQQNYLGFYKSDFAPCNYEIENSIVMDSDEVDDDGNPKYFAIPIDIKKGLPLKVQLGGTPTKLEKAPEKEGGEEEEAGEGGAEGEGKDPGAAEEEAPVEPEYRDWKITFKGKEMSVRAIYVKQTFAKVTLKAEASGRSNDFDIPALSKEDREYIKQFK